MKINKQKFICILAEEINSTLLKEQLSPEDTKKIVDRFMKKLDSIDMSLDLIYTSLVGTGYSLAGVRAKQKGLGRAMVGQPAGEVNEAKERIWRVIDEEVDYVLNKRLISEQEDELAGEHDLELVRKRMDQFDDEIDQAQQELNNATDTRSRAQAQKKLAALMKKKSDLSDKLSDLQLGTKGAAKAGRGAAVAQKGEKLRHKVGRAVFSLFGKAAMGNDWKKMDDEQIQQAYNSIFKRSDLSQAEYEKLHRAIEDKSAPVGEKIPLIKKIIGPEGMEAGKEAAEDAAEEVEGAPTVPKPDLADFQDATDAPVSLFKGQGALYQRLYSSLAAAVGAQSKRDKNDVEQVVKLIMKDLSAQLRHNKIKVQENQLIEALRHALAEMVRTPAAASQSMEAYKAKFKEIEKLRKKYKDDPKKLRTLDMDEKTMKSAYAEFKKSYKAGGAATDITSKSQRRVTPEKGVLQVGKAAGGKLKGWKGGVLDQKTITKLIVKNLKPFIAKALKDRGREDLKIKENNYLDSIVEVIIDEMQSTQ